MDANRRMYPDVVVNKLRRQIKILKLKLIIASNEWVLDQGYGAAADKAAKETDEARAALVKMKLTKAEEQL